MQLGAVKKFREETPAAPASWRDYHLIERLGGKAGEQIWKAEAPGGFLVALRFTPMASGPHSVRQRRALEILRAARHPNLIGTFGAWQDDGRLIVATELAEGSLWARFRKWTEQGAPGIPRAELLGYLADAAKGIDYLNESQVLAGSHTPSTVLHRDVRPSNLLLFGGGVKVADLGMAKAVQDDSSEPTGEWSFSYSAPEFFHNRTTRWSDQYSLAVCYCELLTGKLPHSGSVAEIVMGHLGGRPDLSGLPSCDRPIVERALHRDPERRWPHCRDFIEALRAAPVAGPVVPPPLTEGLRGRAEPPRSAPMDPPAQPSEPPLAGPLPPAEIAPKRRVWPRMAFALTGVVGLGSFLMRDEAVQYGRDLRTVLFSWVVTARLADVQEVPGPPALPSTSPAVRGGGLAQARPLPEPANSAEGDAPEQTVNRGDSQVVTPARPGSGRDADLTASGPEISPATRHEPVAAALEVQSPGRLSMKAGETSLLPINIRRIRDLEGPVLLRIEGLPSAVPSPDVTIAASESSATLSFPVPDSAPAGDGTISVLATAGSTTSATSIEYRIDPPSTERLNDRAMGHFREGRLDEALADLDAILRDDPKNATALKHRGATLWKLKRHADALAAFDAAIAASPEDPVSLNNRGLVHRSMGNYAKALADYGSAIRLDPKNSVLHFNRAQTLTLAGRDAEAIEEFTEAIRLAPDYVRAYEARSEARDRTGDPKAAEDDRAEARRLRPGATR